MTEFMITTISLGILASLTYLVHTTGEGMFGWLLCAFIVIEVLAAVYALFVNLHGERHDSDIGSPR